MKNLYYLILTLISINLNATINTKSELSKITTPESNNNYLIFLNNAKVNSNTFFNDYRTSLGLSVNDKFKIVRTNKLDDTRVIYRYQQYYKGVLVYGGEYILHQNKEGIINNGNGNIAQKINISVLPRISKINSIKLALKYSECTKFHWTSDDINLSKSIQDSLKLLYYPKPELVVYNPTFGTGNIEFKYRLAYKMDINCEKPITIFIDAINGKKLTEFSLQHNCVSTSVNTIYNGSKTIYTQSNAGTYRLLDDCQTGNISVKEWNGGTGTDINSSSNTFSSSTKQVLGASTLWALKQTYNYFYNIHNRNSFDNLNGNINCYVNTQFTGEGAYGSYYSSPRYLYSEVGESNNINNSFSTIDIMGHEFTHFIINSYGFLIYEKEPGALNESFCDIFGEAVEHYTTGSIDWLQGGNRTIGAHRSLSNPNFKNSNLSYSVVQPKSYQDNNWKSVVNCTPNKLTNDYCWVHYNSGVQNYFFFLLVNGGNGFSGIGLTKAREIAYETMTVRVTSTTNYSQARTAWELATLTLYPSDLCTVKKAWTQVGVGSDTCSNLSNDNCTQAINLTSSNTCSYQNYSVAGATASSGFNIPYCSSYQSSFAYDVWFKFTAQATSHTISVDPEGTYSSSNNAYLDPIVAVYSGCSDGSFIQCEDDNGGGGGNCDLTLNNLNIGTTYYIRLFDYSTATGIPPTLPQFGICVTHNSSTCPTPTNVIVPSYSQTYIDLDWDLMSGANNGYSVRYRTIGGAWNNLSATNSNITINGLTCNTTYEWEVRSECSNGSSNWSTTGITTTSACTSNCGIPTNLQTTFITENSANLNMGNTSVFGAIGYEFRYRIVGSSNWTTINSNGSNTFASLSNLTCNSNYEWQVRTNCGSSNYSQYSNISSFTTSNCPQTCLAPTNLTQTAPSFDKVDMQWTNVPNATSYTVYIKETASSNWFNFATNTNQKSLRNLTCKTDYVWYVVANCSSIISPNSTYSNHTTGSIGNTELRTPINGSSIAGNSITFSWDTVYGCNRYDFEFSNDPLFNTLLFNNTDQTKYYKTGNKLNLDLINFPQDGSVFYWRIIPLSDICQHPLIPNPYNFKSIGFGSNINTGVQIANITVFPNPTTGEVYITNISMGKLVEVFTIDGKKLKEEFTKEKINISDKENGTYILKIDNHTFKVSLKK